MRALNSALSNSKNHPTQSKKELNNLGRSGVPVMRSSRRAHEPCISLWRQCATYYYDARWHTRKTFTHLVNAQDDLQNISNLAPDSCSNSQLLTQQTDFFLHSLKPFVKDISESKKKYSDLLQMHLSALDKSTIEKLSHHLQRLNFQCQITDSSIDNLLHVEYDFCNGPPHTQQKLLLSTLEFFELLNSLFKTDENDRSSPASDITSPEAKAIRSQLASCANDWIDSDKSLNAILRIARYLEGVVTGDIRLDSVSTFNDEPGASKLLIKNSMLCIDLLCVHELSAQNNNSLFAVLLRDLLEIFLTKKILGLSTYCSDLSLIQRQRVWCAIEKITAQPPNPLLLAPYRDHIKRLLNSSKYFGKVHIIPASGAALGHAWISPVLSVVPDQQKMGVAAGTAYLHSGARLKAGVSIIHEWPIYWLNATENEGLYPSRLAWSQSVPVPTPQLELAAQQVVSEWKQNNHPYRFVAIAADSPATGCRSSVWNAVEQGMDSETKLLFDTYNRGLALPDSTIELWERLSGFMRWLESIANDPTSDVL